MTSWMQNHALAERECRTGWVFEAYVAQCLQARGLDVEVPEKSWRASVEDRHAYENEVDMRVNGLRISVKSRRVAFSCPDDIPQNRNPLFVDTVRKWELMDPEPVAVVCVSQLTKGVIWTPSYRKWQWTAKHARDATRGYSDAFYAADRSLWFPLDDLVREMHSVWDGRWRVRRGVLAVRRNRVVRTGTDTKLLPLVGTSFHQIARVAPVERV